MLHVRRINNPAKSPIYRYINLRRISTFELRHKFLTYFELNDHKVMPGSTLIPTTEDKSLLFTNAGMNQFKPYFLNTELAPYPNLATTQLCLRAGGKHNDLDNVGYTNRHLTTFEMLGNFSFNSLTPHEAIQLAWNFLTKELALDKGRLLVTVLEGDAETYSLWQNLGVPNSRIRYCGKKDNFWTMGNLEPDSKLKLPCGPCTEIFYDMFPQDEKLDFDTKFVEIWNLVFMKYLMDSNNNLTSLQNSCIDTGMGLERLAATLQGKTNNFDIDIFRTVIDAIDKYRTTTIDTSATIAYKRIIADHLRTVSFLIMEGIRPGPNGRDYVLRRILRRALRSCYQLNCEPNTLAKLLPTLATTIDLKLFPNFKTNLQTIEQVINKEETGFTNALVSGSNKLEQFFKSSNSVKVVDGNLAFLLYDRHGFPIDLTQSIANSNGFQVDLEEFHKLLENQKLMSKSNQFQVNSIGPTSQLFKELRSNKFQQSFVGYNLPTTSIQATLKAVEVVDNSEVFVVLEPNPFYCLGGGQEPDLGAIQLTNNHRLDVVQAVNLDGIVALKLDIDHHLISHLQVGNEVLCQIDLERRIGLMIHHSATHIINLALRSIYGPTIKQAGSNVYPTKLRFDFHTDTSIDISKVEKWVNDYIIKSKYNGTATTTSIRTLPIAQALAEGALKTELEKYPEMVRLVQLGPDSKELCTGTHVQNIQECFPITILNCSSTASGIRRIEATASHHAYHHFLNYRDQVQSSLNQMKVGSLDQLADKFQKLQSKNKQLQHQLTNSNHEPKFLTATGNFLNLDGQQIDGTWVQLTAADLHPDNHEELTDSAKYAKMMELVDKINSKYPKSTNLIQLNDLILLTQLKNEDNKVDCGKLIKHWLDQGSFGKGGGSKNLARAKLVTNKADLFKLTVFK